MTPEEQTVHSYRCFQAQQIIDATLQDMVSAALADTTGEDHQAWADRIYTRLEALPVRDLALTVVVALHEQATDEARRLWSGLWTAKPEDVPS